MNAQQVPINEANTISTIPTDELTRLRAEVERLKTVPMKYRRMEFNAQLQAENERLRTAFASLREQELAAVQELDELRAENDALRGLLINGINNAEWMGEHIHPCGGKTFQNLLIKIYLPVPLDEPDKSVEAALERAITGERP